jgi:hypothetical protein
VAVTPTLIFSCANAVPESNRLLNAISPKLPFNIASSLFRQLVLRPIATHAIELFGRRKEANRCRRQKMSVTRLQLDRQSHFACCAAAQNKMLRGLGPPTATGSRTSSPGNSARNW